MAAAEASIECMFVADFPLAAVVRANLELRDRPFALVRVSSSKQSGARRLNHADVQYQPHSELSHVSPHARAAGIRPGMTVAQARALVPGLVVTRPSPAAERSADDALTDVAESLSPGVEEGEPGCVSLDLAGAAPFFLHSTPPPPEAAPPHPAGR